MSFTKAPWRSCFWGRLLAASGCFWQPPFVQARLPVRLAGWAHWRSIGLILSNNHGLSPCWWVWVSGGRCNTSAPSNVCQRTVGSGENHSRWCNLVSAIIYQFSSLLVICEQGLIKAYISITSSLPASLNISPSVDDQSDTFRNGHVR